MTRLILVRHGETYWNKEGRFQGINDIPLSREGIYQAERIAERLKEEKISIAYTSQLKRAIQTAQQILKLRRVKLVKSRALNERSYGRWEGLTEEEVKKNYPDDYARYSKDKFNTMPTGGESFSDLRKKIKPFIKELISKNKDKTILIVAHNGPLRVIFGEVMDYAEEKIASLRFEPTSLTIINLNLEKPELELVNCDKHVK